jgi:hypothetical protein
LIGLLAGVIAKADALIANSAVNESTFCCTPKVRSKRRAGLATNLPKTLPAARCTVQAEDEIVKLNVIELS